MRGVGELTPRSAGLSVNRRRALTFSPIHLLPRSHVRRLSRRLFGSANDRYVKSLEPLVEQINELEPSSKSCRTRHCAPAPPSSGSGWKTGPTLTICWSKPSPRCARPRNARSEAPFRCAADGRHRTASRHDLRDEDWRRQDPGLHLPVYLKPDRKGRISSRLTIPRQRDANGWARSTNFSA